MGRAEDIAEMKRKIAAMEAAPDHILGQGNHLRLGLVHTAVQYGSPNPGPVAQAQAAELSERLRLALVSLPAQQAEVFCLRCMSEMSYRDIARQLGIKTSAVGVLLHRARLRLRNLLSVPAGADSTEVRS